MKTHISIGSIVRHNVSCFMYHQAGIVIDSAGTRYGRQYFWVTYTNPETKKSYKTAFWDHVLIPAQ